MEHMETVSTTSPPSKEEETEVSSVSSETSMTSLYASMLVSDVLGQAADNADELMQSISTWEAEEDSHSKAEDEDNECSAACRTNQKVEQQLHRFFNLRRAFAEHQGETPQYKEEDLPPEMDSTSEQEGYQVSAPPSLKSHARMLISDIVSLAADNVNELMQSISTWEAEEDSHSKAEDEDNEYSAACRINQKVERHLHRFFNLRRAFAEHQGETPQYKEEDLAPEMDSTSEQEGYQVSAPPSLESNARMLISDIVSMAADNVNELMQSISTWEAEEDSHSKAEDEDNEYSAACRINQKVERHLHRFFNLRRAFAEHQGETPQYKEEDLAPEMDSTSEQEGYQVSAPPSLESHARMLVSDVLGLAADNVNELMQSMSTWEAEEDSHSKAEDEDNEYSAACRQAFAEHQGETPQYKEEDLAPEMDSTSKQEGYQVSASVSTKNSDDSESPNEDLRDEDDRMLQVVMDKLDVVDRLVQYISTWEAEEDSHSKAAPPGSLESEVTTNLTSPGSPEEQQKMENDVEEAVSSESTVSTSVSAVIEEDLNMNTDSIDIPTFSNLSSDSLEVVDSVKQKDITPESKQYDPTLSPTGSPQQAEPHEASSAVIEEDLNMNNDSIDVPYGEDECESTSGDATAIWSSFSPNEDFRDEDDGRQQVIMEKSEEDLLKDAAPSPSSDARPGTRADPSSLPSELVDVKDEDVAPASIMEQFTNNLEREMVAPPSLESEVTTNLTSPGSPEEQQKMEKDVEEAVSSESTISTSVSAVIEEDLNMNTDSIDVPTFSNLSSDSLEVVDTVKQKDITPESKQYDPTLSPTGSPQQVEPHEASSAVIEELVDVKDEDVAPASIMEQFTNNLEREMVAPPSLESEVTTNLTSPGSPEEQQKMENDVAEAVSSESTISTSVSAVIEEDLNMDTDSIDVPTFSNLSSDSLEVVDTVKQKDITPESKQYDPTLSPTGSPQQVEPHEASSAVIEELVDVKDEDVAPASIMEQFTNNLEREMVAPPSLESEVTTNLTSPGSPEEQQKMENDVAEAVSSESTISTSVSAVIEEDLNMDTDSIDVPTFSNLSSDSLEVVDTVKQKDITPESKQYDPTLSPTGSPQQVEPHEASSAVIEELVDVKDEDVAPASIMEQFTNNLEREMVAPPSLESEVTTNLTSPGSPEEQQKMENDVAEAGGQTIRVHQKKSQWWRCFPKWRQCKVHPISDQPVNEVIRFSSSESSGIKCSTPAAISKQSSVQSSKKNSCQKDEDSAPASIMEQFTNNLEREMVAPPSLESEVTTNLTSPGSPEEQQKMENDVAEAGGQTITVHQKKSQWWRCFPKWRQCKVHPISDQPVNEVIRFSSSESSGIKCSTPVAISKQSSVQSSKKNSCQKDEDSAPESPQSPPITLTPSPPTDFQEEVVPVPVTKKKSLWKRFRHFLGLRKPQRWKRTSSTTPHPDPSDPSFTPI